MAETDPNASSTVIPVPDAGGHGFGTMPVFLAGISTILGAVMFLRFGFAVGQVGLLGSLAIIFLGHLVTVPTALAIAEIATNRKVEGGGEYFIISRSFGTTIGSVIGISLYLSQAISVAFYMIALAEAFRPIAPTIEATLGIPFDPRMVSIPALLLLLALVIAKGADLGVKVLYVVVATLVTSLVLFFLGGPVEGFQPETTALSATTADPLPFFMVFAICFPAFTGMTAGVGLSGDLKDPKTSIPRGTLLATVVGMLVYVAIVFKLAYSAPVDELASNQLVMADIALWGPMILIGLGAATLSSAIGSVLVAPRTLQALCADGAIPIGRLNPFLASGTGAANEPRNATIVTGILALGIAAAGNVDFVARLISMFFMVTYGALCAISFLEHFAAQPSYRPSFKSRWYISLFGAFMCLFMMLQMDPVYAISAILMMIALYSVIVRQRKGATDDLAAMFEGVLTQATRQMHVRLQQQERSNRQTWRPSVIMVSGGTFDRSGPLTFLGWLCHRHGFGTYLHFIKGHLGVETVAKSVEVKQRLLSLMQRQRGGVYVDTIISPSMISALAQSLQLPGVSGLANNTAVFEFSTHDDDDARHELLAGCRFAASMDMALIVLRHGDNHFGQRRHIDVWLTWNDTENANVMILLSYIVLGHSDWDEGEIRVNVALPSDAIDARREEFQRFLASGRLPISEKNLRFFEVNELEAYRSLVALESQDADLTVVGFDLDGLEERGDAVFTNHPSCKDVIFVHSSKAVQIE